MTRGTAGPSRDRRHRRDRHGRGRRGVLAATDLPLRRSRAERFDDLVLDAIDDLEHHWGEDFAGLQFAVEDVPAAGPDELTTLSPDVVADHGVVLAELLRQGFTEAGDTSAGGPTTVASGDRDRGGRAGRSARSGRQSSGVGAEGGSSNEDGTGRDRGSQPAAANPAGRAPIGTAEPVLVVYRRPVEARTDDGEDRADLVFSLVLELVAEYLGRDVEDIDPR